MGFKPFCFTVFFGGIWKREKVTKKSEEMENKGGWRTGAGRL
jgi:hypothetical protein